MPSSTVVTPLESIRLIEEKALANAPLSAEEALAVLQTPDELIFDLIASANRVRRHYKGDEVSLCSIINAKSGHCPEDCAFCSQSAHASTAIPTFDFVGSGKVVEGAKAALASGAHKFGIVTSGYGYSGKGPKQDLNQILDAVAALKEGVDIHRCASLGIVDEETARTLKGAGVLEYHHNLETARSFFPNICTTHDYDEDVETVRAVKRAGLRVCCGGILGLGESDEQRVELAMTLRELEVDSVPVNFLNPIAGTRMEGAAPIPPLDILKIIAMFRMVLPDKDIKVAGGREKNLRDLQCLMFAAGANSTMVGNYLTTIGRPANEDIQMIKDLGLNVKN
ncbi:MAG: biotin synthase BioB [Nitrospinae bacterium]|nr:biotin synthase BioB [Nitrospinota bacterium]